LITGAYTGVIVNGVDFGSGRITSFSNPVSTNITENGRHLWKQVVDIEVYTSGDASNTGTNPVYQGFTGLYHPQFNSLNESLSFDIPQDGGYRYTHSVKVQCYNEPSGAGESGYIIAQRMASGLLNTTPPLGYIDAVHSGFYTGIGKRLFTETIDKLNGAVSVEETFTIQKRDFFKHSVSFDNGFVNITENATIRHSGASTADMAFTGNPLGISTRYNSLFSTSWTRCNALWQTYSGLMGQDAYSNTLAAQPSQLTKVFDESSQEFSYSAIYTNNPNMTTSGYALDRQITFSANPVGITEITEEGSVIAYTSKNSNAKSLL
jgi:hypothetical protein